MSFMSRHRTSAIGRFLVLFLFLFTICFSFTLFFSLDAHASCNSDSSCNGQDPDAKGCTATGTPADNPFGVPDNNDDVQDRWSSDCQTNWPRANELDWQRTYDIYVIRESGSGESHLKVDGGYVNCYGGCWGNMVYAPNQLTEACLVYGSTYCAAQSGFKDQ